MLADIAVQFGTVFLGAYLAFAAEQLRERRAMQRVARTLLSQIAATVPAGTDAGAALDGFLEAQINAVDRWLTAADLSSAEWDLIAESIAVHTSDFAPLIRAEPIIVMPATLAAALARHEGAATVTAGAAAAASQARERIIPLWTLRRPPGEEGCPLVRLYRSELTELRNANVRLSKATADLTQQIAAWR